MNVEPAMYWWTHIIVEFFGMALAVGIAYGIMRTKISGIIADIIELKEWHKTHNTKLGDFMTKADCENTQKACQQLLCLKIDEVGTKVDNNIDKVDKTISNNTGKWQDVATVLGAICAKLEIALPKWK